MYRLEGSFISRGLITSGSDSFVLVVCEILIRLFLLLNWTFCSSRIPPSNTAQHIGQVRSSQNFYDMCKI